MTQASDMYVAACVLNVCYCLRGEASQKNERHRILRCILCRVVHFVTFKNANDTEMKQMSWVGSKCRLEWDRMTFKKVL